MKPEAITKARERLSLAELAVANIEQCKSYKQFRGQWYTFLMANNSIYNALEKGSRQSPQSRQWFGGKIQEKKSDQLLQYLFHARHDDEHGLGEVIKLVGGSLRIEVNPTGRDMSFKIGSIGFDDSGDLRIENVSSHECNPTVSDVTPPRFKLIPVHDRGNTTYDPPASHLGNPIADQSPLNVARLAVAYMASLIEEASRLA